MHTCTFITHASAWDDACIDDTKPKSRLLLLAGLEILGALHHVEAIEVRTDGDVQSAVCPICDDILNQYAEACGSDGHFSTVQIGGRDYVLLITPYCQ